MSKEEKDLIAELIDILSRLIDLRIAEQLKPLEAQLRQVEAMQSEWVDTKEALKITGIKKAQTLKAERERPGTLIVVKFEGRMCSTPRYLRASLLKYNDRKTKRRGGGPPLSGPVAA